MVIAKIVFWISWLLLAYHFVGYGLFLFIITSLFKKAKISIPAPDVYPSITVICSAYNEEKVIEEKIRSFLQLNYPKDRIKMIIISDDSTDRTNEIVQKYTDQNISLVIQKPRAGKQNAHNLVLPLLDTDYVLSTDANSIFTPDCVQLLVAKMLSDKRIGLVSGEVKMVKRGSKQSGEAHYWKYEAFLKLMDSRLKTLIGANGPIYLIKRELFSEIPSNSPDDFERVLLTLKRRFIAAYEPQAIIYEEVTEKATEEISRKVRIITQEWCVLKRNIELLNPFRYPAVSFILFSHKVLRWLFFVFVLTGFVSNAFLLQFGFYRIVFILQVIFYLLGTIGLISQEKGHHIPLTGIPGYFVAMVYSSALAFWNFLQNKKINLWQPVR
ncbi:glycosyltransferase family 2 protein [Candidatus Cloacimonas acidaminovorans]|uniref:Glycosyl transferase, group 2 family protein n=1 Tax=Cloacimonas acidaminovorans (strain Evry) TaxID=459349 RepID=B0VFW4_CLOAI|nr:glycosyltransferase family 2 protein [Candidatus Cloacimonas acidaminovorans]CAO81406.1 glycosyl transferase, group 2 family protein [Candidatus Cloacimonas acidaminovorans str. Evry]